MVGERLVLADRAFLQLDAGNRDRCGGVLCSASRDCFVTFDVRRAAQSGLSSR